MGQIKNIKLHIVTDIKLSSQREKSTENEARTVQLQWLQDLPRSWKTIHQNRWKVVQLLEQEKRTIFLDEEKSTKNLVDRLVQKEAQEGYPGRDLEKANPKNREIPTCDSRCFFGSHLGQEEYEARSERSSTGSGDQGC